MAHFRRADTFHDGNSGGREPLAMQLRRQCFSGRNRAPKQRVILSSQQARRQDLRIERWHRSEDGRLATTEDLDHALWSGTPVIKRRGSADVQRPQHPDVHAVRKAEPRYVEKRVVFTRTKCLNRIELADHCEVPMRVDYTLRQASGSRGIETKAVIFGAGECGIE